MGNAIADAILKATEEARSFARADERKRIVAFLHARGATDLALAVESLDDRVNEVFASAGVTQRQSADRSEK